MLLIVLDLVLLHVKGRMGDPDHWYFRFSIVLRQRDLVLFSRSNISRSRIFGRSETCFSITSGLFVFFRNNHIGITGVLLTEFVHGYAVLFSRWPVLRVVITESSRCLKERGAISKKRSTRWNLVHTGSISWDSGFLGSGLPSLFSYCPSNPRFRATTGRMTYIHRYQHSSPAHNDPHTSSQLPPASLGCVQDGIAFSISSPCNSG